MNLLEQQLHYPLGDVLPEPGTALEVAPGVRWIRMSLPFALNHINLWLLRDEMDGPNGPVEGWTIVDCCISQDESKAQWEAIFATQLQGLPILRVIVTHMHPDHIGLAHWLCERWQAPLWISATDYNVARLSTRGTTGFGGESAARFFASHGLTDPDSVEKIRARTNYYPSLVPDVPRSFHRLMDGYTVRIGGRDWTCISGYGHAPEHIALHCPELNILIGGDMMLPRISTNVSVYDVEPESNALTQFLDSIDKFSALDADTLTLPSHGKPFKGLHKRIEQLHDHHRDRLAEVMDACQQRPCHAADILPIMFKRPLDLHQTTFAMGEAVAHLHALWYGGQLRRTLGGDGIYRFSAA
ncbi:MAG: MBL fold metallo-hydrolase [Rhodoferax sp.]|nr:MBL fold metallo-hydrolase [Rhodoferax sp.]